MFITTAILFIIVGILLIIKGARMPKEHRLNVIIGVSGVALALSGAIFAFYLFTGRVELPLF